LVRLVLLVYKEKPVVLVALLAQPVQLALVEEMLVQQDLLDLVVQLVLVVLLVLRVRQMVYQKHQRLTVTIFCVLSMEY
jgi:hypothetical protein